MRRGAGQHAADNTWTNVVSNGATWYESLRIKDQNGEDVTGLTSDTFQLQFRCNEEDDSSVLTLSTTAGTLSVAEADGVTTLTVNVPQATISSMDGDYIADLVSKAASDGKLTHRCHGVVTFTNSPIAF